MPRIARVIGVGYPYHLVQRGNNRSTVFSEREDFEKYRSLLEQYSGEKRALILSYCLMTNHVHLLVRPLEEGTLAKMMQGIALCYAQYFNRKNERTGRLWESRYYSSIVDEDRYLWAVCAYIENNPVRAGIVNRAEDYGYSSARAHLLAEADPLLKEPLFGWDQLEEYRQLVNGKDNQGLLEEIRRQTKSGKPLGDAKFCESISSKLGRALIFRPRGRPRKNNQ